MKVANLHTLHVHPAVASNSRLKLNPGPGPKPLRTPSNLGGVPGLNTEETIRLQNSFLQLSRGVQCLQVGYSSGSHGHLEQPPNAMSWGEEVVQGWLREARCSCVHLPACEFGMDIAKVWLFATSLEALQQMGGVGKHPRNMHASIAGTKDESGAYLSKRTAQYPVPLACAFADIVAPMISGPGRCFTMDDAMAMIPTKSMTDHPQVFRMGAVYFHFQIGHIQEVLTGIFSVTFANTFSSSSWTTATTSAFFAIFTCIQLSPLFRSKNWSHLSRFWKTG